MLYLSIKYLIHYKGGIYMRLILRSLYSMILLGAGTLHFVREKSFRRIVPPILPFKKALVLITGIFEIIFSMTLWIRKGQALTSKLLALFMIAVFPANIYMAVKRIPLRGKGKANPWLVYLRLPLQIPLIIGALKLGRRE